MQVRGDLNSERATWNIRMDMKQLGRSRGLKRAVMERGERP